MSFKLVRSGGWMRLLSRPATLFICLAALAMVGSAALTAEAASAARYTVAQCGWHVGQDAGWLETSSSKFTSDTYCQTPESADPFENVHLTSSTRGSTTSVSGTRLARWRWTAPAGTAIASVHGQRWQVLGDNFEHRLGGVINGNFSPFLSLASTDTVRRDFSQSFLPFADGFESRLLCATSEDRFCAPGNERVAGVRALTITLDDPSPPTAYMGGPATGSGWMRGVQTVNFGASDTGSGLRFNRTYMDGAQGRETEHPCDKSYISGQWMAVKMLPCRPSALGVHQIDTTTMSDGPHRLGQCAFDFAGNVGCAADTIMRTDNNAPGSPKAVTVTGGDGWHRDNGFQLGWVDPDQGVAAPIVASHYRVTGPGFDSGVIGNVTSQAINGALVPGAGEFRLSVWLIDAAGNESEASAAAATLRLDNVAPAGYLIEPLADKPELIHASVSDAHSGVASSQMSVQRVGSQDWINLPTSSGGQAAGAGAAEVEARFPSDDLDPGRYLVRIRVVDVAGNEFVTDRRGNGSPMELRAPIKTDVQLSAHLESKGSQGLALKVPYGTRSLLVGRLVDSSGRALADQTIQVKEAPAGISRYAAKVNRVTTGRDGGFSLALAGGPSRKLSVQFDGSERYSPASVGPLDLKVRGLITLVATPRRLRTGQRVRLRGRVSSRDVRRGRLGSLVAIQYFEKGAGRWRPVLVTRTNRFGRYRASYRFRYITGSARIRLRAKLLPRPDFPYAGAVSRPVRIEVRPRIRRPPR